MANGTYTGSYGSSFYLEAAEPGVTFTSSSTISATTGSGIVGGTEGAYTVDTAGTITAAEIGIYLQDGGSIENEAGGYISGGTGIQVAAAAGTVENDGTIVATTGAGISLLATGVVTNAGSIDALGGVFIYAGFHGAGSATNTATGTIAGGTIGIEVKGKYGGSVYNAGFVEGAGTYGVGVSIGNEMTLTNAGTIEGIGNFATAIGGGTSSIITNLSAGTILSTGMLQALFEDLATIDNSGLIEDTGGGAAIRAVYGLITNERGGTITGRYGIRFLANPFQSETISQIVNNAGLISAPYGIGIDLGRYSEVDNLSTGTIEANGTNSTAINATGHDTIINDGLIREIGNKTASNVVGSTAIGLNGGSFTNNADGTIIGRAGISIYGQQDNTMTNAGTIYGSYAGVLLNEAVASITNEGTGTISGYNYAILAIFGDASVENGKGALIDGIDTVIIGASSIDNAGTIEAMSCGQAVEISAGTLTNEATGTIEATATESIGIDVGTSSSGVYVENAGLILASRVGIEFLAGGTITNETGGVIEATEADGFAVTAAGYGTVTNDGKITALGYGGKGIVSGYGTILNAAGATIAANVGLGIAVDITHAGTVENAGWIEATGSAGIGILMSSGQVENEAGGVVYATTGILSSFGDIHNYGTIDAKLDGVDWGSTGVITNRGLIEGATGIYVRFGPFASIVNFGTIVGTADSVDFTHGDSSVASLSAYSGADFIGLIQGGSESTGTRLDIASGNGTLTGLGGTGTISGDISGTFTGFGRYEIDGGTWTLEGTNTLDGDDFRIYGDMTVAAGATLVNDRLIEVIGGYFLDAGDLLSGSGTILVERGGTANLADSVSGIASIEFFEGGRADLSQGGKYGGVSISTFGTGDTLDLTGVTYQPGETARYQDKHLYVYSGAHALLAEIAMTEGTGFGGLEAVTDGNNGTLIETVICFMPGTRIATPGGEVAVEHLAAGDLVSTMGGDPAPIRWIGRQTVSTKFGDSLRILPIRITAGALGENLPVRDLLCSPDHAILIHGVLVQAGALVNGNTIRRETDVPEVFTYYHIECDGHELILAEGVPAETFVDNIDRLAFDNWEEHLALYPNGKPVAELPYPRAKSLRQVPPAIRERFQRRDRAA